MQIDLLVTVVECIGFPVLVSWMCNQQSVEKIDKCLNHPLQTTREEIISLKNAKTAEERGKYLVLAYMCLKDRKTNVINFDKNLFDSLRKIMLVNLNMRIFQNTVRAWLIIIC